MLGWITVAALLSTSAALAYTSAVLAHVSTADHLNVEPVDHQIQRLERLIMSEAQNTVNALVDQLRKVAVEVKSQIADVQAQLDAAQVNAEKVDLSALTEAAQALDDIVPDAASVDPAADPAATES